MPPISAFYGIVIWMYHDESHHLGRPHFHARYGDDEASIEIETLEGARGRAPATGVAACHGLGFGTSGRAQENWDRGRRHQPLQRIEPLR